MRARSSNQKRVQARVDALSFVIRGLIAFTLGGQKIGKENFLKGYE